MINFSHSNPLTTSLSYYKRDRIILPNVLFRTSIQAFSHAGKGFVVCWKNISEASCPSKYWCSTHYVDMLKIAYMTIDVLLFVFIRFSAILHYINIQIACSTCINIHLMSYHNRPSFLSNFILIFEWKFSVYIEDSLDWIWEKRKAVLQQHKIQMKYVRTWFMHCEQTFYI